MYKYNGKENGNYSGVVRYIGSIVGEGIRTVMRA